MKRRGYILMTALLLQGVSGGAETPLADCVIPAHSTGDYMVLLHGMGRTRISMSLVKHHLERKGYTVVSQTYPSRKYRVDQLSDEWLRPLIQREIRDPDRKVHFVTHSLGGIVLRHYLEHNDLPGLGRVVMLAPPNQGSELVNIFDRLLVYRWAVGPAGLQLGTDEDAVPFQLGPANYQLGVIAGTRSLNPIYSRLIPGSDDGKVSVARAKLEGMHGFLTVPYSHTWLMNRKVTLNQIETFIRSGAFMGSVPRD